MAMLQVQVGKNFINDVLNNGSSRINIVTENLRILLGMSKPNSMPYNLHMVDQIIAKPLGLIKGFEDIHSWNSLHCYIYCC